MEKCNLKTANPNPMCNFWTSSACSCERWQPEVLCQINQSVVSKVVHQCLMISRRAVLHAEPSLSCTHCTDERQVQDRAKHWYSSDETYDDWEESPAGEDRTRNSVRSRTSDIDPEKRRTTGPSAVQTLNSTTNLKESYIQNKGLSFLPPLMPQI